MFKKLASPKLSRQYTSTVRESVHSRLTRGGNQKLEDLNRHSIGKVINKTVLGRGAFSKVNLLLSGDKKTEQAVKIKKESETDDTEELFHNYVLDNNLQKHLLVPQRTLIDENRQVYEIMPLAHFGDANKLIDRLAELNENRKELVMRHALTSLINTYELMHNYGVMHLDGKTANTLFDRFGNCFVADFDWSIILKPNGEYFRKPKELRTERKFDPLELPLELDVNQTRKLLFSSLDAYRLGLTLLCIYCQIKPEAVLDSQFRNIAPEKLKQFFEEHRVPTAVSTIIGGLLEPKLNNRMTLSEASQAAKNCRLSETERAEIQSIFKDWCQAVTKKITPIHKDNFFRDFRLVPTETEGYLAIENMDDNLRLNAQI